VSVKRVAIHKARLIELAEKYKEYEKLSAALLEHANKI
jgi:hypothetical protein